MQVIRYNTAAEFLDHAGTWLEQAEVENNLIIGIASYFASYVGELKTQPYFAYFQNQLPRKIADQSLFVWENKGILSMAGIQRETRHGVAI